MHHFDYRAEPDHAVSCVTLRLGGKQQKRRPDALAATFAQVIGDFRDGLDGGNGVISELALNSTQIVMQQVEDLFRRRYGSGAQWLSARTQKLRLMLSLIRPVVGELHVDAEVFPLQHCNHFL